MPFKDRTIIETIKMHPLLHRPLNHSVLWYKSESFWWFLSVTNIKSLLTLDPLKKIKGSAKAKSSYKLIQAKNQPV